MLSAVSQSLPLPVLHAVLPALRGSLRQAEAALLAEAGAASSNAAQNRWLENAARLRLGRLRLDDAAEICLQGGQSPLPQAGPEWYARCDLDTAVEVVQSRLASVQDVVQALHLPDVTVLARVLLDWCRWQRLDASTSLRVFQGFRQAVLDAWPGWCRQWVQQSGLVWPETVAHETEGQPRRLPALLEAVQRQQARVFREQDMPGLAEAKALDVAALLRAEGHEPEVVESETLDLIDRLFGFLVQDGKLAAPVRGVLLGLQLPMIRLAFDQTDFFSRSGHPARLFLNQLATASLALDEQGLGDDPVFQAMRAAVQQVLDGQRPDTGLFAEALADFSDALEQQSEAALLAEERLRGAEVAGALHVERHQQVDAELAVFLAEPTLPDSLRQFLDDSWRRVLLLLAQQPQGLSGDKAQQYRQLLADLVWSVQPVAGPADRQRLLKTVPGLLKQLRTALTWAGQGPAETESFFQALEAVHLAQLRGKPVPRAPGLSADAPAAVTEKPALEACYDQVDALSMGVWVEFQTSDIRQRCKLAAVIRHTGRFVFVNRSGAKVADKNRDELARDIQEGRVRLLEDMQLFDRALASVIDNTRQRRQ